MVNTIDITNTLATHEQVVIEFIRLIEDLITQLRADIAALKAQIGKTDPETQAAIDKLQGRIDASTTLLKESRGRII